MNTSAKYQKELFNPMENNIFHLVTGVTAKRILFYSITSKKLKLYSYIDCLH
jgi:hypothetical protein